MNKASSKNILDKIITGEINILIGTQLISKGFHFPNLNCIVILDIDLSSQGHDLRSAEKNLQLYHQLLKKNRIILLLRPKRSRAQAFMQQKTWMLVITATPGPLLIVM